MKYFIITVDTEGDNLWEYVAGKEIGTENAKFLQRFQTLCENMVLSLFILPTMRWLVLSIS